MSRQSMFYMSFILLQISFFLYLHKKYCLNISRFRLTRNGMEFYKTYQLNEDESENIIFISSPLIVDQKKLRSTELHCDGTFKITPNVPKFIQLFTIHVVVDSYVSNV